jgi:hypothetical protein
MTAMLFPYKEQSRANKDKKFGGGGVEREKRKTVVVEKVVRNILLNWCLSYVPPYTSGY